MERLIKLSFTFIINMSRLVVYNISISQVLKGMCFMNSKIFKSHLREFYPLITKLVCCDQV